MTDYKKYALGQVENFLYDAMSTEATAQEIYDVIKSVVEDNYVVYSKSADQAKELLDLLNGKGSVTEKHSKNYYDYNRNKSVLSYNKDSKSEDCKKSWNDFWEDPNYDDTELMPDLQYTDEELDAMCDKAEAEAKDKVKSWVIPVDDDYNITFPEDLLEQTGWKEGDILQWIDQGDGSFKMIKKEN